MSKLASVSSGFYNPDASPLVVACRVARTIYDGCARLKGSPYLGRVSSRMTGRREMVFAPLPCIAEPGSV
jgi:hypothetical protein